MDGILQSEQEMANRLIDAARSAEATGSSTTVKMLFKWIGERQRPEAILRYLTPERTEWLLNAIRTTRIRNKRQSQKLATLAETIEGNRG